MTVYKLPRRRTLTLVRKEDSKEETTSPLDAWDKGFSVRAAQEALEATGTTLLARPDDQPVMPKDVTGMSSAELGAMHAHFAEYTTYLDEQCALLEIPAAEESAYLAHVEAEVRLRKAGTVKDKDSKALQDPRYVAQEMQVLQAKAKAKILRSRVAGYERCANALSREISRRTMEWERHQQSVSKSR